MLVVINELERRLAVALQERDDAMASGDAHEAEVEAWRECVRVIVAERDRWAARVVVLEARASAARAALAGES